MPSLQVALHSICCGHKNRGGLKDDMEDDEDKCINIVVSYLSLCECESMNSTALRSLCECTMKKLLNFRIKNCM